MYWAQPNGQSRLIATGVMEKMQVQSIAELVSLSERAGVLSVS